MQNCHALSLQEDSKKITNKTDNSFIIHVSVIKKNLYVTNLSLLNVINIIQITLFPVITGRNILHFAK